ncbi:50S ribosomal protein L35 [Candidatus Parcubacteria bacterium]|nr:MAG: 50S ribosomal protein L35 [Candidatus Parcubacteria bacterium]
MLKTKKAISKRIKVTSKNKFIRRKIGQNHFNAKQSGNKTRSLHKTSELSAQVAKRIKRHLPYA